MSRQSGAFERGRAETLPFVKKTCLLTELPLIYQRHEGSSNIYQRAFCIGHFSWQLRTI